MLTQFVRAKAHFVRIPRFGDDAAAAALSVENSGKSFSPTSGSSAYSAKVDFPVLRPEYAPKHIKTHGGDDDPWPVQQSPACDARRRGQTALDIGRRSPPPCRRPQSSADDEASARNPR